MYSFVVMGVVTVFEWELLFPELLDVFVLSTLPIPGRRLFWARIAALVIFLAMFLVGMNLLGAVFFPLVADMPGLVRYVAAHVVAVGLAGVFVAAFFLGLQGVLILVVGQRLSRSFSPLLQGAVDDAVADGVYSVSDADDVSSSACWSRIAWWCGTFRRSGFWGCMSGCWLGRRRCRCLRRWLGRESLRLCCRCLWW